MIAPLLSLRPVADGVELVDVLVSVAIAAVVGAIVGVAAWAIARWRRRRRFERAIAKAARHVIVREIGGRS